MPHEVRKYIKKYLDCHHEVLPNPSTICIETIYPKTILWNFQYINGRLQYTDNRNTRKNKEKAVGPEEIDPRNPIMFRGNIIIIYHEKKHDLSLM